MTILPGETACLACLMADAPPPGTTPTCDTAGILAPIVGVIASIEAGEALKILSGTSRGREPPAHDRRLVGQSSSARRSVASCEKPATAASAGTASSRGSPASAATRRPCCAAATPCSSAPPPGTSLSLEDLAARLAGVGRIQRNAFLLRLARRRLRADGVSRRPHDRRRHERHRHGPHGACTLHRCVIARCMLGEFRRNSHCRACQHWHLYVRTAHSPASSQIDTIWQSVPPQSRGFIFASRAIPIPSADPVSFVSRRSRTPRDTFL